VATRKQLNQILEAWYEADTCSPAEQAAKTEILNGLLDLAIQGTPYSRMMLIESLKGPYKEHRRARRRQDGIPPQVENQLDLPESP